jgi:hypothetical protein
MNNLAASCGVPELGHEIVLKPSPPNVLIGDPVPKFLDSTSTPLSVASTVEPPLKACGNDELRIGKLLTAGNSTRDD